MPRSVQHSWFVNRVVDDGWEKATFADKTFLRRGDHYGYQGPLAKHTSICSI